MINPTLLINPRILIVDDDPTNLHMLDRLLDIGGYDDVRKATSGAEAIKEVIDHSPDLVLLDLHMPGVNGYEVLRILRQSVSSSVYLPILVFTADATHESRKKTLELGASDFLTKPGDATEILLRIRNFLTMRGLHKSLNDRNVNLEGMVLERTRELENAQVEIVERLARAGEHRDDITGEHTKRVGDLSSKIARLLGLPELESRLISLAARLHDLGKIGVPDSILMKPDKLSPIEFTEMQNHCAVGASILSHGNTMLIQMAERIAMSHHERYDGKGYPHGLIGESIPIEARIVAVADVFDALTHERPYKKAWEVSEAVAEIQRLSGEHFDPRVVNAFLVAIGQDPVLGIQAKSKMS